MHTNMNICIYNLISCKAQGEFFSVHIGKVIISMDTLVCGEWCACYHFIKKNKYNTTCICLGYCFDDLSIHVENAFFF